MNKARKVSNKFIQAGRVFKNEGMLSFTIKTLQKVQKQLQRSSKRKKVETAFLVKHEDVTQADWYIHPYTPTKIHKKPPFTINWVMSPPADGLGGGHQNMFRFITYLESRGHRCNVYLYSNLHFQTAKDAEEVFLKAYPNSKVAFSWLKGPMAPADAVFATGWETAYPVFNDKGSARKFYFVQDFEPFFYPLGSEYVLAENTYRFNFFGITAGGWLSDKLSKEFGMRCGHYDFGVEKTFYQYSNAAKRKEIFFYARPVTTRRGFELGIMALERFHKQHPEYTITLAGWDVSEYKIPFPYKNLKSLRLDELSDVYNRCAAGLVISLTNMSLLPLELLACGTIPVVTEGENNRKVSDNPYIKYAHASPDALAQALHEIVTRRDLPAYARMGADSVGNANWEAAGKKLESIVIKELHG